MLTSADKLEEGKEYLFRPKNDDISTRFVIGKGIYIGAGFEGYSSFISISYFNSYYSFRNAPHKYLCKVDKTDLYFCCWEFFKPINRTLLLERLYFHAILLKIGMHEVMVKVIVSDFFPDDCIY